MPDDERPHFEIREEIVRTGVIHPTGHGVTYPRSNYAAHGAFLLTRAREYRSVVTRTRDAQLTGSLYLQITTPKELPIKNEKQRFRQVGLNVVRVSATEPNVGTARISKREFAELESRISRYASERDHPNRSYLSAIEDLSPVSATAKVSREIDIESHEEIDCLLYLFSDLTERERAAILLTLRNFLVERGHEVTDSHRFASGVTAVKARLRPDEMQVVGDTFSTLRLISPNHVFYVSDSSRLSPLPSGIEVRDPTSGIGVAVVDSGINQSCPLLAGLVSRVISELPPGASTAQNPQHGTFVASRVLYGDDLEMDLRSGSLTPACLLVDVTVLPTDAQGEAIGIDELDLAKSLERAIPQLPAFVRVINLSLGTGVPINDDEFSAVAQVLDKETRDRNILAVVTAGNIRDPRRIRTYPHEIVLPFWRIDTPADSLLAVTVGSIARYDTDGALSRPRELSPFSRRGPGGDGGIKPELVMHGGNCHLDGNPGSRIAAQGIHGSGTYVAWDFGTSFSAPLISRQAAQLFHHYNNPPVNLVKALLCHFTLSCIAPPINIESQYLVGFGEPQLRDAKWASTSSAAFLYVGVIQTDTYKYLPFSVPSAFAPNGAAKLKIRITVVFDPPVNSDNPAEYARSRISVKLLKLTANGLKEIALEPDPQSEARWRPVMKFSKTFRRSYASGVWECRLRLWTRDLPDNFRQSLAVVIEVIDEANGLDVWRAIEDESGHTFGLIQVSEIAA